MSKDQKQHASLYLEFLAHGAEPWQARYLTARLPSGLGDNLRTALDMFWERQWQSNHLWDLDRYNKAWRKQPVALFAMYDAFMGLGCPANTALLAVYSPSILRVEQSSDDALHNNFAPQKVWEAILALRECGYDDGLIRTMLSAHPKAFLKPRERIMEWHREVVLFKQSPLIEFRRLMSGASKPGFRPRTGVSRYTTDLTKFPQEPSQNPTVPTEESVPSQAAPEQPARTTDPSVLATGPVETPQDAPVPDEPPGQTVAQAPESIPDAFLPAPPRVPNLVAPKHAAQSKTNPPSDDGKLKPLRTFKVEGTPPPKPTSEQSECEGTEVVRKKQSEPPPPYVPDDATNNWLGLAQAIFTRVVPNWNVHKWEAWVKNNPWVYSTRSAEARNMDQVLSWIPFSRQALPNDARTKLVAGILLNRYLFGGRKNGAAHGANGRKTASKPPDCKLSELLRLSEEAVYFRFYVLRSIVKREPLRHPDALTYAFEAVEKQPDPVARNFSVPPPPMTDETMWQAKAAELRWRVHEIERRANGCCAGRKPFVIMLAEPKRERFLERLNAYIERNGCTGQTPVPRRWNRGIITPYSSLA